MSESVGPAEGQRQQLLERLRTFEEAAAQLHPEKSGVDAVEIFARFQDAAQALRLHLSRHLAMKETVDWPQLPDSDADITAFAGELKLEHKQLLADLAELIQDAREFPKALDRSEAARLLRERSRELALRVARHAGDEEAPLGRYS
jgi:hypothetical protein